MNEYIFRFRAKTERCPTKKNVQSPKLLNRTNVQSPKCAESVYRDVNGGSGRIRYVDRMLGFCYITTTLFEHCDYLSNHMQMANTMKTESHASETNKRGTFLLDMVIRWRQ